MANFPPHFLAFDLMVIKPGITSSWTKNPPEEWLFTGTYQLMDEESSAGKVIPPGITSSWMKNPLQEWDSSWNYQLINVESIH
jgi:hypothetical protein